jgi:hypothetical protein
MKGISYKPPYEIIYKTVLVRRLIFRNKFAVSYTLYDREKDIIERKITRYFNLYEDAVSHFKNDILTQY